jgi:type I protein arginine methyltransferase
VQRWLTTAPGSPTNWYQLRCVLSQPLYVMAGQEITGRLHLVAHSAQSSTIYLTMSGWTLLLLFCSFLIFYNLCLIVLVFFRFLLEAKMWGVGAEHGGILQTSTGKLELKEPYYRLSQPQSYMVSQDQQQ